MVFESFHLCSFNDNWIRWRASDKFNLLTIKCSHYEGSNGMSLGTIILLYELFYLTTWKLSSCCDSSVLAECWLWSCLSIKELLDEPLSFCCCWQGRYSLWSVWKWCLRSLRFWKWTTHGQAWRSLKFLRFKEPRKKQNDSLLYRRIVWLRIRSTRSICKDNS